MSENDGDGARRERATSAATLRMLRDVESRFGELIGDLDLLGLSLTAARAEHALDTFRQEAEQLSGN